MSMIITPDTRTAAQLFILDEMLARQRTLQEAEDLMEAAEARLRRELATAVKGSPATQAEEDAVGRAMTVTRRRDVVLAAVVVFAELRYPPMAPLLNVARLQGGPADGTVRNVPAVHTVVVQAGLGGTARHRYTLTGYDLMSGHYVYTYEEADQ